MDYKLIYDNLINRAKTRSLDQYTERHHIIPQCMGGSNDASNLVNLTPEEHYVAHQLLVKIHPNIHKLVYAAKMMTVSTKHVQRNNKTFGWIRRRFAELERNKHVSAETRKKMSEAFARKERITCPHCGKEGLPGNMRRWHFDNCSKGPNKTIHTIPNEQKLKIKEGMKSAVWATKSCQYCGKEGKQCVISTHEKFCKSNPNHVKKTEVQHTCIHCGKTSTKGNITRWHNDNCKNRPR